MLARTAEALYWVGRYVERADDSAAVLAEALHELSSAGASGADLPARSLLAVLGVPAAAPDAAGRLPDPRRLATALTFDPAVASSVASSVHRARDNARGAREVVSVPMWECLNVTANALPGRRRDSGSAGPHGYLAWVRNQAAMFAGLADSTIARDDGWRFLVLGRALERAEVLTRLLLARAAGGPGAPSRSSVLRCVGGHDAFLRASRGASDEAAVVRFLTVDATFPRSLLHTLAGVTDCLAGLAGSRRPSATLRLAGQLRSQLEYGDPATLLSELPARLHRVRRQVADLGAAVTAEYFDVGPWITWRSADGVGGAPTPVPAPTPVAVPATIPVAGPEAAR